MDIVGLRLWTRHDLARTWGRNVRARRHELGLTLAQVVEIIGPDITTQTISKIELGERLPRDYVRFALALALAIDVDELFPAPTRRHLSRFRRVAA